MVDGCSCCDGCNTDQDDDRSDDENPSKWVFSRRIKPAEVLWISHLNRVFSAVVVVVNFDDEVVTVDNNSQAVHIFCAPHSADLNDFLRFNSGQCDFIERLFRIACEETHLERGIVAAARVDDLGVDFNRSTW